MGFLSGSARCKPALLVPFEHFLLGDLATDMLVICLGNLIRLKLPVEGASGEGSVGILLHFDGEADAELRIAIKRISGKSFPEPSGAGEQIYHRNPIVGASHARRLAGTLA